MAKARDSVRITAPAIEALSALGRGPQRRRQTRNGPVEQRNHLDALSPSLRRYVLARCLARGAAVTAVRVISADEVIVP